MEWLQMVRWSPYMVGIGIGVLSWLAFLFSNRAIGCSTAFARTSGMIEKLFLGAKVDKKPYYKRYPPVIDWEWMLVVGILIGAFISAKLSGEFKLQLVPDLWVASFGPSPIIRTIFAIIGGVFIGFGSRWAGGCTSGHGISGTLQLAISSWLASIFFFIGGIITAIIIFHVFV